MADAGARAHDLHVARFGPALVAEAVLMRDRAFADVGDDFHVRVRMGRESGLRRYRVVVPDAQRAPVRTARIVIGGEREMMLGVEPAVVGAAEAGKGSALDHRTSPKHWDDAR